MVPVQDVVSIEQVKEDGMYDHFPHIDDPTKQLLLEGGGPCSSPLVKSMQSVMELDGRRYPAIDDSGYHLPQDLHQTNPYEVDAYPLGYHHQLLPGTRRREFSSPECGLYDGDKLLPVPQVRVFLLLLWVNPHPAGVCPSFLTVLWRNVSVAAAPHRQAPPKPV